MCATHIEDYPTWGEHGNVPEPACIRSRSVVRVAIVAVERTLRKSSADAGHSSAATARAHAPSVCVGGRAANASPRWDDVHRAGLPEATRSARPVARVRPAAAGSRKLTAVLLCNATPAFVQAGQSANNGDRADRTRVRSSERCVPDCSDTFHRSGNCTCTFGCPSVPERCVTDSFTRRRSRFTVRGTQRSRSRRFRARHRSPG